MKRDYWRENPLFAERRAQVNDPILIGESLLRQWTGDEAKEERSDEQAEQERRPMMS